VSGLQTFVKQGVFDDYQGEKSMMGGVMMKKICLALVLLGVAMPGVAETINRNKALQFSDVIVTANKLEESIQDVPMSISAFDALTLDDRNISSVEALSDYVPNLILLGQGTSSATVPTMRGITAELGTYAVSTAMFIDGIPVLSFSGYEDTLQNIERVEVLRGPQGTLYGKNAEAGAINIITRQPDNRFQGSVSVDGGEDYKKEACVNISGPVIQDKLFFSVSGQYYSKDGFITNRYTGNAANDKEHWYGKGQVKWAPTDTLAFDLIVSRLEYDNDGNNMGLSEYGAAAFGLVASGDRNVYSGLEPNEESKSTTQSLKVSYDLGETLSVTSITTHRLFADHFNADYDFNPLALMHSLSDNEYDKISQELRLSSNTLKMKWVAGLYYDKDDDTFHNILSSIVPAMNTTTDRRLGGEGYAVFGQLRYALTSRIGVTGGLRYEKQDKDMRDHLSGSAFDGSWDDMSPKFSVDYTFTPQVMGYLTVAKGFRSGGFNAFSTDPEYDSYDNEALWSYEIGAKTRFFDNRLIVNGALFYMNIDDMQVTEWVSPSLSYITNAATAVSYGAELEVQARITPQFTITGNIGCTNAEFDEYQDALDNYCNNKAPNVPGYTFSLGGQYRTGNGFYAGVDVTGCGKMYLDNANRHQRDAYQLVNAKAGYEAARWDIYLYGKNIFDQDYTMDGFAGGFYKVYSDPREVGLKFTYRF